MQISNNSPSFGAIAKTFGAHDIAAYLKQNRNTSKEFDKAYARLNDASRGKNILLDTYDTQGISVKEVDDFNHLKTINYIAKSSDFINGMKKAAVILEQENKPHKAPRQRFPGHLHVLG